MLLIIIVIESMNFPKLPHSPIMSNLYALYHIADFIFGAVADCVGSSMLIGAVAVAWAAAGNKRRQKISATPPPPTLASHPQPPRT